MKASFLSIIESVVIIATLIVLMIYTKETARLRKEAQKQNEIMLRPLIMPSPINPFRSYSLKLKNIGKSPAFNIEIDTDENPEEIHSWTSSSSQTFLAAGEESLWDASPLSQGDKTMDRDILLEIQYANIEGQVFFTKVRINFHHESQLFLETGKARTPWQAG